MVEDLDDPEALAAASAMQTQAYLVYIKMVRVFQVLHFSFNAVICRTLMILSQELEIPFPGKPWYHYRVCPIAPSLRAEDKDRGYAPDMCVPIFPNASHPLGRTPIHTDPVFPYDNCYHWAEFHTDIRVRARPEHFDERRATMLPSTEYGKMDDYVGEDIPRMDELQRQHRAATGWHAPPVQVSMILSSMSSAHPRRMIACAIES